MHCAPQTVKSGKQFNLLLLLSLQKLADDCSFIYTDRSNRAVRRYSAVIIEFIISFRIPRLPATKVLGIHFLLYTFNTLDRKTPHFYINIYNYIDNSAEHFALLMEYTNDGFRRRKSYPAARLVWYSRRGLLKKKKIYKNTTER